MSGQTLDGGNRRELHDRRQLLNELHLEGPQMRTIEHWIAGKLTAEGSSRTSVVYNPATGGPQADVLLATKEDVDTAVSTANSAFAEWSQSSLSKRTKVLFAF